MQAAKEDEMSNVATVRRIYRDFMAGDAQSILAVFEEDVEFRLAQGHPYRGSGGAWVGPKAVAQHFFAVAGPEWDQWAMAVTDVLEAADAVVVEGRYTGIYQPTRNEMNVEVCHVWRFRGDKVKSFHQYVDTAGLRGVMGVSEPGKG
jgi:ketosteroid isomerase-like protein